MIRFSISTTCSPNISNNGLLYSGKGLHGLPMKSTRDRLRILWSPHGAELSQELSISWCGGVSGNSGGTTASLAVLERLDRVSRVGGPVLEGVLLGGEEHVDTRGGGGGGGGLGEFGLAADSQGDTPLEFDRQVREFLRVGGCGHVFDEVDDEAAEVEVGEGDAAVVDG